jgi:hypothetical protein
MGKNNQGKKNAPSGTTQKGIYRDKDSKKPAGQNTDSELRVAEFSYQNDALAELVVQGWDADNPKKLTQYKSDFPQELTDRGIHLSNPVVITEAEYYDGYTMGDPDEVVFVLPDRSRADTAGGGSLLEAAKLLMACTPNGI